MTPDQISQLRIILNNIVGELDCFDYREPTPPESRCLKHAIEALALLPCSTCNGTKQISTAQSRGFGKENEILDSCPDCQEPKKMLTEDYMECWLAHPKDDEDCNMCLNIKKCRELRKYWRPKPVT